MGAGGLDSVDPRLPRQRTKLDGLPQCLGARAGEIAAAHLDHDVVERAAGRACSGRARAAITARSAQSSLGRAD